MPSTPDYLIPKFAVATIPWSLYSDPQTDPQNMYEFFFFLAAPSGMWDLSSPARD